MRRFISLHAPAWDDLAGRVVQPLHLINLRFRSSEAEDANVRIGKVCLKYAWSIPMGFRWLCKWLALALAWSELNLQFDD